MAMLRLLAALLVGARMAQGVTLRTGTQATANPVRKVVTLLQKMYYRVEEEGKKEADLYKKFACYCKSGVSELRERIESSGDKAPQLEADIKASEEQLAQTKQDLKDAQKERSEAKEAIAAAAEIREKGAKSFAEEKAELEGYISQITGAVKELESGTAGSFLQTSTAMSLKKLAAKVDGVSDDDKVVLISFLDNKQESENMPKGGEVVGILKGMSDSFAKALKDAEDAEAAAIKEYEALVGAKKKEIHTLTTSVETKLEKVGELGTLIVEMKADFEDIAGNLLEDKKLLSELEKGCSTKDSEYEERVKIRSEELAAIADTIKILNDDDALELFKKTLPAPSASLVQIKVTMVEVRERAVQALRKASPSSPSGRARLNFLVLGLRGKKIGFDKIIKMIDEMIDVLKHEQNDDADKKEYCQSQLDSSEDKKKELEGKLADTETAIASSKEGIKALGEEIPQIEKSIQELDKSVREATAIRKEENDEFKELRQSNAAAKELLRFAKNRLNKFYNPKLYKPPAEADAEFFQMDMRSQGSVEPPPETWDAYAKQSEESTGVIQMIDILIKDLDTETAEAEVEEKNSQEDYDKTIADSKKDRVSLSKSLKQKSATIADLKEDLETLEATRKSTGTELMSTEKVIGDLHGECDWLLKYFDVRAKARAGEVDALEKAKAVLSGADYSLLQGQQ